MALRKHYRQLIIITLFLISNAAYSADLKILIDTSTDMPMALIQDDKINGGIHYDFGIALAKQLDRTPRFILMPRKRIALALENGEADLSCHYLPAWLPGNFDWSVPFMPNGLLLVSDLSVPKPSGITALANIPIGTVMGFRYKEVENTLGEKFIREDAMNATLNLRKLAAGRMHYALVGELFFLYQKESGTFSTPTHPPMVIKRYESQCAISKKGQVKLAAINPAIAVLKKNKQLTEIYKNYHAPSR
jgi:polar amino acid transport system substrate-binding protein